MSKLDNLRSDVNELVEDFIRTECTPFAGDTKSKMGLDERAFSRHDTYYNSDVIIIPKNQRRTADYYGGLEYVDKDYVFEMGDYVFYSAEDSRIAEHLSRLDGPTNQEESEEG